MNLIIGLGNPGGKYQNTRHNIGFEIINHLKEENNFPDFRLDKKLKAEISIGLINNEKTILAKPQTYMNLSGQSIKKTISFYNISLDNLLIVHDEIDLLLNNIRISQNKNSAGHKGIESIIKELGTKDFARIRIGIQPESGKPQNTEKFVLQKFSKEQEQIIIKASEKILSYLKGPKD